MDLSGGPNPSQNEEQKLTQLPRPHTVFLALFVNRSVSLDESFCETCCWHRCSFSFLGEIHAEDQKFLFFSTHKHEALARFQLLSNDRIGVADISTFEPRKTRSISASSIATHSIPIFAFVISLIICSLDFISVAAST